MSTINSSKLEDLMDERRNCWRCKDFHDSPNNLSTRCPNELKNRSKSESEIYFSLGLRKSISWFKDCDNSAVSPSDSIVTIIRVKRKSQTQNIVTKHTRGGILGDGTHLGKSSSMVNLATTILRDCASCVPKEDRLVPLSSWDGNDVPVSTVSDTGINFSKQTGSGPLLSLLSFAAWNKRYAKKEQHLEAPSTTIVVEPRIEIINVLSQQKSEDNNHFEKSSKTETIGIDCIAQNDEILHDITVSSNNVKDQSIKQSSSKLSIRMHKAFQRVVCSCIFKRIKKKITR